MQKFLFAFLVAYGVLAGFPSARAATYAVQSYTGCEVPGYSMHPCPQPKLWHSVNLGALAMLSFDRNDPTQTLTLVDVAGNNWSRALASCRDSIEKPEGCSQENDLSDPANLSLNFNEWSGDDSQYFSLKFLGDAEVRLFLPPSEEVLYILSVKKTD